MPVQLSDLKPGQQKALRLIVKNGKGSVTSKFSHNETSPDFRGADVAIFKLQELGLVMGKQLWGDNASGFGGCIEYTPTEEGLRIANEIREAFQSERAGVR